MLASQDDAVKRLLDHWDERYGPDGYTTTMIWDEGGEHSNGWLLGEHYEPDQRRHQGPPLNPYRWDPAGER